MILFIDGSSLLSTSYYGTLPKQIMFEKDSEKRASMYHMIMHTSDGRYTNGIFAFMKILTKILNNQKPSHVFIAFDKTRATFRRDIYSEYKGQRKATPAPLKEQFVTLENMLKDSGFVMEISDDFEADDLIGSGVEMCKGKDSIRLYTKDQDYFQLVDDDNDARLWMPMDKDKLKGLNESYRGLFGYNDSDFISVPDGCFEFSENTVEDYFSVPPRLVVDYKAIAGDSSDNIPGVRGVSSAASPLLKEYGSLESILEAIDECEGDKKKEKELNEFWKTNLGISRSPMNAFKTYREDGLMSKKLAKIRTDCLLQCTMEDMQVTNIDWSKLNEWYRDLEMKSLIRE